MQCPASATPDEPDHPFTLPPDAESASSLSPDPLIKQCVARILAAPVYDVAIQTPLHPAPRLSARLDNQVLLKREDLQPVFSFKLRGAYAKLQALSDADRGRGVICASAGNHAQGVALAARHLGISAVVVMPAVTPEIKVDAVRKLDARVVIHGDDFEAACAHATEIAAAEDLTFIHPYDDPDVITGQGTIALELFRQCDAPPDYLFICVGGGGLAAGMALVARYLQPGIRIIGVEAEESASMKAAFEAGHPVTLERVGHFAEGVAVRRTGDLTFAICHDLLDEVITVDNDEICAAVLDVYEDTRAIAEPAGVLAVAGIKKYFAGRGGSGDPPSGRRRRARRARALAVGRPVAPARGDRRRGPTGRRAPCRWRGRPARPRGLPRGPAASQPRSEPPRHQGGAPRRGGGDDPGHPARGLPGGGHRELYIRQSAR